MPTPVNVGGLVGALGNLANVNARNADERRQRREQRMSTLGALGGAAVGGAVGGPQGALMGLNIGRQAGSALGGGQVDAAGTTASVLGLMNYQQQQDAATAQQQQRETVAQGIEGLQAQPQSMINPDAPATEEPGAEMGGGALDPGLRTQVSEPMLTPEQQQKNQLLGVLGNAARLGNVGLAAQGAMGLTQGPKPPAPPSGYQWTPQGTLSAIPGGPSDKPDKPDDLFGTGLQGRAAAMVNNFNSMRRQGVPLTPKQEEQDDLARAIMGREERFVDPSTGGVVTRAPMKIPPKYGSSPQGQAAVVSGGGASPVTPITPPKADPVSVEAAGKIQMLRSARDNLASVRSSLIGKDGSVNKMAVASMAAALPFTEGRMLYQQFREAIAAKLRAETGATARPEELDELEDIFLPSTLDSDAGVKSKLDRMQRFLEGGISLAEVGRRGLPGKQEESKQAKGQRAPEMSDDELIDTYLR